MRGDEAPPDPKGGGDKDRAARVLRDIHHRRLGLVDRFEHLARAVIEDPAIFGGLQRPGGAVEQAHAEVLFQFGYAGRGDGGRTALIAGCRTHAAQFIDTDEHSDVVHIGHGGAAPFFAVV